MLTTFSHKLYGVRRIIQEKNNKNMQKRKQGKNVRVFDVDVSVPQVSAVV